MWESCSLQEELETDAADCWFSSLSGVEGQEWLQEQQAMHLGGGAGFVTDEGVVTSQRAGERQRKT